MNLNEVRSFDEDWRGAAASCEHSSGKQVDPQPEHDPRQRTIDSEVLTRLFTALDRHDHETMAACYAENASFRDSAFKLEGRTRIHAMWHMICDGDIRTTFKIDEVDERTAFVTVVDDYTFRAKGRKVHDVIQSRFRFKDGSIVEQQDSCDIRKWASMAIGGVGGFLAGRISLLRGAKARRRLDTFIETHPQYRES